MAARNAESTIEEAVQSVLAQQGVSFELLVGDDASTDGTWSCLQRFRKDRRVRLWRFRLHQGAGATRNRLISRSKGRYLSICDADDRMLPGNLWRLSRALDRWPKASAVNGSRILLNSRGRLCQDPKPLSARRLGWDLLELPLRHAGAMLRRKWVCRLGGYRSDLPCSEDYDLFLRLGEVGLLRQLSGQPVYVYRVRKGSLSDQPPRKMEQVVRRIRRAAVQRRFGMRVAW